MLSALIDVAPSAVQSQNCVADTPLHLLISFNQDTNTDKNESISIDYAVTILLNAELSICKLQDNTGATPHHLAIANNCSECGLNSIVSCCPEAYSIQDDKGLLPLHHVTAFSDTPLESVKRIFDANSKAIFQVAHNGDTPLHIAVSNATSTIVNTEGKVKNKYLKLLEFLVVSLDLKFQSNSMQDPLSIRNKEKVGNQYMFTIFCFFVITKTSHIPLMMQLTPLHCCALFIVSSQITKFLMGQSSASTASLITNIISNVPSLFTELQLFFHTK